MGLSRNELEERIRAARPPSPTRADALTEGDRAALELVLASEVENPGPDREQVPHARSRDRWHKVWAAIAALVLLAATAPLFDTLSSVPTASAAPPPLEIAPIAGVRSTQEILLSLSEIAATSDLQIDETIEYQGWYLSTLVGEDGAMASSTEVTWNVLERLPGGSTKHTIYALGPDLTSANAAKAGAPAYVSVVPPDESASVFGDVAPTDASEMSDFLSRALDVDADTSGIAAISSLHALKLEQNLDGSQTAAALRFLAKVPDVRLVGSTTDRLGREALVFEGSSPEIPDYVNFLVVAPETGEILAYEEQYVGSSRTDIHSPKVVAYTAWSRS